MTTMKPLKAECHDCHHIVHIDDMDGLYACGECEKQYCAFCANNRLGYCECAPRLEKIW